MKNILFVFVMIEVCIASAADLSTVSYVDVTRYLGTWYQVAHKPLPFEGQCACSTQVLSLRADGNVGVVNSCNDKTPQGVVRSISGFATNDDPATNARFTVDLGLPRKGQYWIIGLGDNYEYAVVSEPTKASLYILSKTPTLDANLYYEALTKAKAQTDLSGLELTWQQGCTY